MKLGIGTLLVIAVGLLGEWGWYQNQAVLAQQSSMPSTPSADSRRIPVVVELFTSEGCSSCPPADQLLLKLQSEQPIPNAEIIALEEHVDYWNSQGWIDPFSSPNATERQLSYAGALANGNSYTPQMVVDGQSEFVGTHEGQARSAIETAAGKKKVEVSVTPGERNNNTQGFRVTDGALQNSTNNASPEVWMAVTETGLHSNVKAGENSGADLHHAAVVRRLTKIGSAKATMGESFSGEQKIKLDNSWKRENVRVVVFLQEKKSKRILGVGSARLPA